ncbi:MAG: class I adenylate-forming enzyme family protein [Planctomycetota bacterium]
MPEKDTSRGALRDVLHRRLAGRSMPLLAGARFVIPAASIWTGARTWVRRFRELGLTEGDRVVLSLPRSPASVMVTTAAWWEGLTVCFSRQGAGPKHELLRSYDARLMVSSRPGGHTLVPDHAGACPETAVETRRAGEPTAGVALLLESSGTSGSTKRIALSYSNLLHQVVGHAEALGIGPNDVVCSVLPWDHAFGLLVSLWPALLSGATVVVDPHNGRRIEALIDLASGSGSTRLDLVPRQVRELSRSARGTHLLRRVQGVVGGAPVTRDLVGVLNETSLRVGYGQTEASPGVALGRPGEFSEGWLGRPVGCETSVVDGTLRVRGKNVCAGFWDDGRVTHHNPDRWLDTGDVVQVCGDGFRFVGRADHRFKLENGRLVDAPLLEVGLREATGDDRVCVVPGDGVEAVVVLGRGLPSGRSERVGMVMGRVPWRAVVIDPSEPIYSAKGDIDRRALNGLLLGGVKRSLAA